MSRNRREREERRSRTNGPALIFGVIGVIAALSIAWALTRDGGTATDLIEFSEDERPDAETLIAEAQGITKGDPNAPVQIIEFGDYQCPGCQAFAAGVVPRLQAAYIDSGYARLTFYDFPLTSIHPHAVLAARAARCAGDQGRYWDYHDVLFGRQGEWSASRRAADRFEEYAGMVGLDAGAFSSCLRSDRFAQEVSASARLGRELRVGTTPTVFVNGTRVQTASIEGVTDLIEAALGRSGE